MTRSGAERLLRRSPEQRAAHLHGWRRRFLPQLAMGIVLRVGWMVAVARPPEFAWADPWQYLEQARLTSIGHWGVAPAWPAGSGQATSFLSVGYPGIVGTLSRLTGVSPWHVALGLNVIASAVLIVGVAVLAERIAGQPAAMAAAWIVALFPDLITATSMVMTELVGVALLVGVAVSVTRTHVVWWHSAVLIAGTVWVRPSLQVLLVVVPLILWRSAGMRCALQVAGLSMVLMFPLLWHSSVTVGGGVGLTTATWINVCEGAAPDPGTPLGGFATSTRCAASGLSEAAWVDHARAVAVQAIREDPVRWVAAVPARLWHSFEFGGWGIEVAQQWGQNLGRDVRTQMALRLSQIAFVAVVLAGLLQTVRLRQNHLLRILVLLALTSLVGVIVTFGQQRFGLPTVLLVFVPAASSLFQSSRFDTDAMSTTVDSAGGMGE